MTAATDQGGYLAAFDRFYEAELKDWLRRQENRRVRAVVILAVAVLVVGIGGGLNIALSADRESASAWSVILGIIILMLAMQPYMKLRRDVKTFLAGKIAGHFGLHYHPGFRLGSVVGMLMGHARKMAKQAQAGGGLEGIDRVDIGPRCSVEPFRQNRLVPSHDKSRIEDIFLGEHDGVDLTLFEAQLLNETRDSDNRKKDVVVFQGLLVAFSFHKPFQGRTLVLTDHGLLGNWLSSLGAGAERVRLEDPRFEDAFEVYSTDQVEARYLLTPAFMERVQELSRALGNARIQLAFADDLLRMSVRSNRNWFEAGNLLWRRVDDEGRVRRMAKEITTVFEMIDILKINMATRV